MRKNAEDQKNQGHQGRDRMNDEQVRERVPSFARQRKVGPAFIGYDFVYNFLSVKLDVRPALGPARRPWNDLPILYPNDALLHPALFEHHPNTPNLTPPKLAMFIAWMIGALRVLKSSSTNAASSNTLRGVAGRNNIARINWRYVARRTLVVDGDGPRQRRSRY